MVILANTRQKTNSGMKESSTDHPKRCTQDTKANIVSSVSGSDDGRQYPERASAGTDVMKQGREGEIKHNPGPVRQ